MAIAGPLALILGVGAVLGAATSQAIPTRLEQGGDRPWGEVNPERYPEIVAVTYDSAPGMYYAPHAYTAVSPVIPLGPWDLQPVDDYLPASEQDQHPGDANGKSVDVPANELGHAVSVSDTHQNDDVSNESDGDQIAADHDRESQIVAMSAPAGV